MRVLLSHMVTAVGWTSSRQKQRALRRQCDCTLTGKALVDSEVCRGGQASTCFPSYRGDVLSAYSMADPEAINFVPLRQEALSGTF
jgi:hypothetical protein